VAAADSTFPYASKIAVELGSVSCVSASACVAVGDFAEPGDSDDPVVGATFDGTKWSIRELRSNSGTSFSASVSCALAKNCVSVENGFVERWNGRRWDRGPQPRGLRGMGRSSVSCPRPSVCTAVGDKDGGLKPIAARYR
jgi:hypothetical protein